MKYTHVELVTNTCAGGGRKGGGKEETVEREEGKENQTLYRRMYYQTHAYRVQFCIMNTDLHTEYINIYIYIYICTKIILVSIYVCMGECRLAKKKYSR